VRRLLRVLGRLFVTAGVLTGARLASRLPEPEPGHEAPRDVRGERIVMALFGLAGALALAFVVAFARGAGTPWLGGTLGPAFGVAALALGVASARLVDQPEAIEERPELDQPEQVDALVEELRAPIAPQSRRRLLLSGLGALGAFGVALVTPLVSLGPSLRTPPIADPWRKGRRLVDEKGRAILAREIVSGSVLTAFPEGTSYEEMGAPVVVVRVAEAELDLPEARRGWAPGGLLAYSKICTHAACAVSLYQTPLFAPTAPGPALVCPCHYSTFDVLRGAEPIFGPAVRALPQLPLVVDRRGRLVAGGPLSGPIGPSWSGVRA
jgi:ubiquinol-cytochrome c reductase iron-sulfur subunit